MMSGDWKPRLARIAPGMVSLLAYKRSDLPHDLIAGLSVAAVAVPVGVAYAQLAGFSPAVGLYASILPLVAYTIFGTSRQLIVGPDAAVCALVAAAVGPLSAGDQNLYWSLSETLTLFVGIFCIAASFVKLGGIADFLSKPILVGFLNGVAIHIALGQLGKIFGFGISSQGIIPTLVEFATKLNQTHLPTVIVGLASFAVLAISPKLLRRLPAALVAMIAAGLATSVMHLQAMGVKTVGPVAAGLPQLRIPHLPPEVLPDLLTETVGVALISFSSMMLTCRSFASRNRYDIDADKEFAALGAANIASALCQGFAVSGADSRTAVNDSAGGRTQVAGLVAAGVIAAVLMFLTGPLQYVPMAALGAVLVKAALSLADVSTLKTLYRIDRREFALSIVATVGVVAVGAVKAILIAVILAILRFVRLVSRPKVEILGTVEGYPGLHSIERHKDATTIPGLVLFRFNAPIVFFNAPYFKREALAAANAAGPELKWFVMDMIPVTLMDATGLYTAADVIGTLSERGVVFATAGRLAELSDRASKTQRPFNRSDVRQFPTLRAALQAYRREHILQSSDSNLSTERIAG